MSCMCRVLALAWALGRLVVLALALAGTPPYTGTPYGVRSTYIMYYWH